jgi:hypothetical protein
MRDDHPVVAQGLAEPDPHRVIDELVERRDIPPALDVGLPGAERAVAQRAAVRAVVVDLEVPRAVATDHDVGGGEQVLAELVGALRIEARDQLLGRGGAGHDVLALLPTRAPNSRSITRGAGSLPPENIQANPRATALRPSALAAFGGGRPRRVDTTRFSLLATASS